VKICSVLLKPIPSLHRGLEIMRRNNSSMLWLRITSFGSKMPLTSGSRGLDSLYRRLFLFTTTKSRPQDLATNLKYVTMSQMGKNRVASRSVVGCRFMSLI
jgi:hypothetical protein